jgi:hypothetical protein
MGEGGNVVADGEFVVLPVLEVGDGFIPVIAICTA